MDLRVGPIEVRVIEPLKKLSIHVGDNDGGIRADLVFEARHAPIQEPRFTRRQGPRMFMDYTRMTQNGAWSGTLRHNGGETRLDPAQIQGTRDRSWGIRPVGAPDAQPAPGGFQFFWLWAPFNFNDRVLFFHTNDDEAGKPWNRRAVTDVFSTSRTEYEQPTAKLAFNIGTRRIKSAEIALAADGPKLRITPTGKHFYMNGLGYTHPTWGHGRDHGAFEAAYDVLENAEDGAPGNLHIQALAHATLEDGGRMFEGVGVLEQLLIGPHAPSGFTSILDPAS